MKNYEEGNLEDSDSDGDIHLDSGSDGTGYDIVHECDDVRWMM